MGELSQEALQRIALFFLTISAALFGALVVLVVYLYVEHGAIGRLKGSLLAETALQQKLMAESDPDHVAFPHVDPSISFVLNPAIVDATWVAAEESSYSVNSLGLRGEEILAKGPRVKRILLVGDSVVFGWRLEAGDTLASRLQKLLDSRMADGPFEVLTVALPGWNTIDQDAFLRSHLARLDPDYVVWSLLRNDLTDTAAAAPPGVLIRWASPQKKLQQPVQISGAALSFPAPTLLERWRSNLGRILAFSLEFEVPVSVLWWREPDRALIDSVIRINKIELPVIYVPGELRFDRDHWCVAFDDCHPTRWANDRLALAVMDELVSAGIVDSSVLQDADMAILELFRSSRLNRTTAGEQERYFAKQTRLLRDSATPMSKESVLFGVTGSQLQENGLMLFRREGDVASFYIDLEVPGERPGPTQAMSIKVRDSEAVLADQVLSLYAGRGEYSMRLDRSASTLYEVEWQFAFSECRAPGRCFSATLIEAGIR